MAKLGQAFDSNQYEDMSDYSPFPAGEYVCQISNSEIKSTKDKTGKYINLTFKIIEGEHKGRIFWNILNIINQNQQAVEIANKEFATIARACGINRPIQDTEDLHGIPLNVKVKVTPAKGDWPAKNESIGYSLIKGSKGPVNKPPVKTGNTAEVASDPGWG